MKKSLILLILPLLLLSAVLVSAGNLEIEKKTISDIVVSELSEPAVFELTLRNLGSSDNFEIYSLVGVDMSPKGTFQINKGETKTIEVKIFPNDKLKTRTGLMTFAYKIRGQDTGIQDDMLTINIVSLKDVFEVGVENINPESENAFVYVINKVDKEFPSINGKFSSAFFDSKKTFSVKALGREDIVIPLDSAKLKKLVAGQYILSGDLSIEGATEHFEGSLKFVEKNFLSTSEKSSGILFRKKTVEKTNEGNVPVIAEISMSKDIISRLFTVFSEEPKAVRSGLIVKYTWVKEIRPSETFSVSADTNYLYPLIMLVIIIIVAYLIYAYKSSNIMLKKRVSFVRTKGGEFALKVTLGVSSKRFIEKISVIDKIPSIAKIYDRFGATPPTRIDERNGRLEWDIESLQSGEERVFSYIIYSKVSVVGRFELPPATAVYERDGKIYEAVSNKAFFVNEPVRLVEN